MDALIDKDYIKEFEYGLNFAYVLNDNSIFFATEYKMLQSQTDGCFVKCMKMMYNGKIQLYYLTDRLKPILNILPSLDSESFLDIMLNLISNVINVKQNGFLSCQNIDISFEHIYVDPDTNKVYLVYLPLSKKIFEDTSCFENEFRKKLVKLISEAPELYSSQFVQVSECILNDALSIENILEKINFRKNGIDSGSKVSSLSDDKNKQPKVMRITSINTPKRIEFVITKDSFVFGKKAELCDGVIDFNMMISRTHCCIKKIGSQYTIMDLQSLNGTFVNKVKIQPYQQCPINDGDIIRLANIEFRVSIA